MIPFICDLDEGRVACWMRAVGRADASWSVASVKSVTGGHGVFAFSKINNSNSLTKMDIFEIVSAHKSGMQYGRAKRLGRFERRIWRPLASQYRDSARNGAPFWWPMLSLPLRAGRRELSGFTKHSIG